MRYIKHILLSTWYRWFRTADERVELELEYYFEEWCAQQGKEPRLASPGNMRQFQAPVAVFRSYARRLTAEKNKKINHVPLRKKNLNACGPEISCFKMCMQYFLLMCLDDV